MKYLQWLLIILLIIIFSPWFVSTKVLVGGDWPYLYQQTSQYFDTGPAVYKSYLQLGLYNVPLAGIDMYYQTTAHMFSPIVGWAATQRLFWFIPFLLVCMISSYLLTESVLGVIVYTANTYILMIVGGGQMGIALAYAIAPLVVRQCLQLLEKLSDANPPHFTAFLSPVLTTGGLFAVLLFFDARFFYLFFICYVLAIIVYAFAQQSGTSWLLFRTIPILIAPFVLSFLLNAFWILPLLVYFQNPLSNLGSAFTSVNIVRFLSFATFENSLGLLHPNWPENIFGKITFMRPEFLLLPLIAFSSFLFYQVSEYTMKKKVLFFAILGLLGIFLAKGANEPFGAVYIWLFTKVWGFSLFRDPTKWYVFIALSYSFLISQTYSACMRFFENKKILHVFSLIFIGVLLVVLEKPALMHQLTGTFQSAAVPVSYNIFSQFMNKQKNFSRILWIPTRGQFSFYSALHPAVTGVDFFHQANYSQVLSSLQSPNTAVRLQESSIGFIVVPHDAMSEIFVKNRLYNDTQYQQTVTQVRRLSFVTQAASFGKIAVFNVPSAKDHFWMTDTASRVLAIRSTDTAYKLSVTAASNNVTAVFSENFDPFWEVTNIRTQQQIPLTKFHGSLMSFQLSHPGTYDLSVTYKPATYSTIGLSISELVLGILLVLFVWSKRDFWSKGRNMIK